MNTVAIARLLARHLTVENPSRLGGDAALDVLAALNAGLQQFFSEAPARLKKRTYSRTIQTPQDIAITVTAQFATTLTTSAFASVQVGSTVQFADAPDNEVASAAALFDGHLSSTLTGNARVFSDALPLVAPIERLTSDIRVYGSGWNKKLVRDDLLRERRVQHQEGPPAYYQFESRGSDQTPEHILRIWPLPDTAAIVRFEAEFAPQRFTLAHLVSAAEIPLPDQMTEDMLVPLCTAHLTDSPLWADKSTISRMVNKAADVLGRKIPLIPRDTGVPNNTVGTPKGF